MKAKNLPVFWSPTWGSLRELLRCRDRGSRSQDLLRAAVWHDQRSNCALLAVFSDGTCRMLHSLMHSPGKTLNLLIRLNREQRIPARQIFRIVSDRQSLFKFSVNRFHVQIPHHFKCVRSKSIHFAKSIRSTKVRENAHHLFLLYAYISFFHFLCLKMYSNHVQRLRA